MKKFVYASLLLAPALTFAVADLSVIADLATQIAGIVAQVIPIMFGLVIVYFFYGLTEYVRAAGDPKKAGEGKSIMIYGVIAIAVMVMLSGLVAWLGSAFGINANATAIKPPTITGL